MKNLFINNNALHVGLVLTLFFMVGCLPLINDGDYVNSTVTSKTVFFIYGLLIIFSLYTLQIVFRKNKALVLKISKVDIVLSVLFIFIMINRYVIQSNYGFSIRFIELLGLGVLYIVLRGLTYKSFIWILLAVVISGIIQAVYGNLQLLGYYASNHSGFKITGSFFNPGPYAGFLAAVWPIALGMYLYKERIVKQVEVLENKYASILNTIIKYIFEYIPLFSIISMALVLPASRSRAAWLAVTVSSLILLELKYHILTDVFTKINKIKKTVVISIVVLITTLSLFGVYHMKKGSSDGRLFIWKVTTEIIKENLVFGVGFDRFKAHYMNAQADYFEKNGETAEVMVADNSYYAFNEFLQFFSENGLVGLLFFIVIILILSQIKVEQENRKLSFIFKVSVIAIGVFACFSYPMQILPIKIIIIVVLALLTSLDIYTYKIELTQLRNSYKMFKISLLVIVTFCIVKGSLYSNRLSEGFKSWQFALAPYLDYETTLKEYENVYPFFKNNGDFLMNYGKTLSLAKKNIKAIAILNEAKTHLNTTIIQTTLGDAYKSTKQYYKAEEAYTQAYNMVPSRFYPLYLLVKLYDECGDGIKAIKMANNLLNKDVKVPSTAIKEMEREVKVIILKIKESF